MKHSLRLCGLIALWAILALPAHAAWTATAATGIQVTAAGDNPRGIAVHVARRLAVVANQDAATVSLVNLDTGNVSATISVAAKPRDVVIDVANARAYVLHEVESLSATATVSVIDLVTQTRVTQWTFTGEFEHPLLNNTGTELLLADEEGKRLLRVSTADGAVLQTITLTYEPQALAFSGDGNTLLIGTETGGVRLVSTTTWLETHSIATKKVKSLAWWSGGSLAAAVIDDRNLLLLDLNTRTVAGSIAFGGDPGAVAVHNDIAYVAHQDNNTVSAINLTQRMLLGRYSLGYEPYALAIDATPVLLASLPKDDQLLKLDPATATLTPVVLLADKLKNIAVNNTTDQAVALPDKERAYVINLIDKTTTEVTLPAKPTAVGIDTAHGTALIGFDKKQGLRFLDLATKALLPDVINLDQEPTAIAVDPTRHLAVIVVDKKDQLLIIDTNTRALLNTLGTKGKFMDVAVHGGRGKAYVVNQEKDTGELIILDLTTRAVAGTIAVTKHAQSIVIDEALDRAVVAIEEKDKLEVVDLQTNLVIASYPLAKHPRSLALNPMTHTVVIAAKDSDQIALLDLNTSTLTPNFATLEKPQRVAVTTRYNQALAVSSEKGEVVFIQLPNPVPTLTELVPPESPQTTSLTILAVGDKFIDGVSKVVINGQFVTTRWKDAQHLEADVPPAVLGTSGAYPVKVVNAAPGGGESQILTFTVLNPAPVLTDVTPASLQANSLDQTLTLTGDKFIPGSQAFFGAQALITTYVSATQLTAVVSGTLLTTGGQVPVTVFNPAPGGGTSAPVTVTVIGAKPTITGFTPTEGPVGTQVTITGTNFDALNPGSNTVQFNGVSSVVASATETVLKVIVPTTATTGPLSVTTKGGTATSTDVFTVQANQDFDLTLTPASLQIPINGYGTTRVKLTSIGLTQYTQLVSINVTGLPAGITAKLDRPNVYLNQDTLVTLINDGTAAPGTYTVNLTGNGLSDVLPLTRPKTLTVQVLDSTATTVTGRVLHSEDDSPFVGALVHLGTQQTYTDATGTYRFVNPSVVGDQVVLIDANVANTPTIEYPGKIVMPVMIQANKDNPVLTSYVRGIDPTKFTQFIPGTETHVTSPDIPNYELRIPQGAVLYSNIDGTPITKINVKVVPVDRLPVKPLPEGVNAKSVYLYYFFKEGGANPTRPIPVTMNNDIDALPGDKVDLWYYDESLTPDPSSNQWRIMGTGTVTADGKSIVSDPGVGIPKFCCGATTASNPAPPPPPPDCPKAGNPVSLSSGAATVFEEKTFGIQGGKFPVSLSCGYSSVNPTIGFFGRGTYFNYDWRVQQSAQAITVISPNGTRYNLSQGTDGIYRASTGRADGLGMEARTTSSGIVLTRKNGTIYEFDTRGFLAAQQDPSGNRITIARDSNNYATSLTDANGRVYTFATTRISIGRTIYTVATQITDPLGRTQKYAYDTQARLLSVTDALNQSTGYSYDTLGRIFQKTDPRGAITQYEYDSAGRTIKEILPDNSLYQFAYTVAGNTITETKVTDPNGNVTTHRFNGQGVELRRIDALGRVFKKEIDYATNLVTSETDPLGRVTRYTYDANGNRTSVVDPEGNTTIIEYDQQWNKPVKITDALGQTTTFTYNAGGTLASITNAEKEVVIFAYTPEGKLNSVTDPLGHVSRFEYDSEGNLVQTINALGHIAQRRYDLFNRLVEAVDRRGRSTRYSYDTIDRLTEIIDAFGSRTGITYDAEDNLETITDAKGSVIQTNVYDSRSRVISRADALGKFTTYTYDGAGNLATSTDRKGQVKTYIYDALSRVSRVTYADGRTTEYTYDLVGNMIRASDSVSGEALYAYDNVNRLLSETTNQGVVSYRYNAVGRLVERRINSSDPTVYTYDKANRVKTITYRNQTVIHAYDKAGRLVSRTLPNGITQQYAWDDANELLSIAYVKSDGSIIEQISYSYDENGNRITRNRTQLGSVPETPFTATYDANNRMLTYSGQPLTYDDNGNLISRQTPQGFVTYTWDAQNRLTQISGPNGTASFKYDYRGRRIEKTINGVTTAFLYDGQQAIAELQGSSIGTTYLTGLKTDEVLARYANSGNRILLTDALGSVLALTDDSQTAQTLYGYSPYGEQTQVGENSDNSLQYTGRENDNTGLYFYRARYFDPQLKRFISSDPIGIAGGINMYAYARQNPINFNDPLGLYPDCVTTVTGVDTNQWEEIIETIIAQFTMPVPIPRGVGVGAGGDPENPRQPPIEIEIVVDWWEVEYKLALQEIYLVTEIVQHMHSFCTETRKDECGKEWTFSTSFDWDKISSRTKTKIDTKLDWSHKLIRFLGRGGIGI